MTSTGRVGVDVGGTFTDVHFISADGTGATSAKHPTTRPDPTSGILGALRRLGDDHEIDWADVEQITVGSTLALNAVIEGRGAATALIATRGFRDVLDIARERRAALYDLQQLAAPAIVPRQLRFEVDERIAANGDVVTPLDLDRDGSALLSWLDATGVESVAISLINSYAAPGHEERLRDLVTAERPHLFVCASVDGLRQYREYERTLVTCINAYVGPTMTDYLRRLEAAVAEIAPTATVRITDSVGGAMNLGAAGDRPVLTVMSGPASGVAGLAAVAEQVSSTEAGRDVPLTVVGMDMGGTSCDVAVVDHGRPDLTAGVAVGEHSFALQAVDIHSIGAGGGTVAWVDDGGLLRVGPRSTGSVPGPACYGNGGTEPTITDAHLVLGHLAPDVLLGDQIRLDVAAAEQALATIAEPLGMNVRSAALGVLRVADASMGRAVETITVRRGIDPRSCALVAYGGAAPLHSSGIAREMGIGTTIVPRFAGVLSAMGAVWAPEHYEAARALLLPTRGVRTEELAVWVKELDAQARASAGDSAARPLGTEIAFDMRFAGQTASLRVPVPDPGAPDALTRAHEYFTEQYRGVFGYVLPTAESEIENLRVRLTVREDRIRPQIPRRRAPALARRPWRAVFPEIGEVDCELWEVSGDTALPARVPGPAIVVGAGSTAVIHDGQVGVFDPYGNLIVRDERRQR
jgi:N-methylhydantoinase A